MTDYKKLYNDPNIDKYIGPASEKYDNGNMEKILGIGLNMPFENTNSAARKLMFASQYQQHVCLTNPEVPLISTGYENKFGEVSSSVLEAEEDMQVIARIEKYKDYPGHHYYLITKDVNNKLGLIERIGHHHNTETYGYTYDNKFIDSLKINDTIYRGEIIRKSSSFDDYDNYMTGTNLFVTYMADSNTTEDAIELSESAAKKLTRVELKTFSIYINDNSIPLNLYGNNQGVYKIMPDIGEEVKNGIICGIRTENKNECFFTQANTRLNTPMINDELIMPKDGKVVDIDVRCNKDISTSPNRLYEGQLEYYINDHKRFCQEIVDFMSMYIDNTDYKKSHELSEMYYDCKDVLDGKQYIRDDKIFSNIIIDITIQSQAELKIGDKITSRYGGKGVVSKIYPDNEMPRLHGTERQIDMIWNIATCVNRLNPGQLFEVSLNYISNQLVSRMFENCGPNSIIDDIAIMFDFYKDLSPEWAEFFINEIERTNIDEDIAYTINDFIDEDHECLYIPLKPISESMTFNKLMNIYAKYPWITPSYLDIPVKDSRGLRTRFVKSNKPCIPAMQYIYRMKQNAEEKHSATAMSAVNIRNENSKSKASKQFTRVHSSTPIRFGEMEGNIFNSMNAEVYVMMLMLYSTSPQGRRDAMQLLTKDPYNINVTLNDDTRSRSVEKVNAILKTMGYKFSFNKILIKYDDVKNSNLFKQYNAKTDEFFKFYQASTDQLFRQYKAQNDEFFKFYQASTDQLFRQYKAQNDPVFKLITDKRKD